MNEPIPQSPVSRLKRPLILAVVGVLTISVGAATGLWINSRKSDNDEGTPSNAYRNPHKVDVENDEDSGPGFTNLLKEDELDLSTRAGAWGEPATETDRIANHVKVGDDALRVGDYKRAIDVYRFLLPHTDGAHEAAIRYRLALSSECSGAEKEALRQYQAIAQKFAHSNWNDVAQLGRIRCLAQASQTEMLDSAVYRNMILDNTALTPPIRREVLHTAARGLCGLLLDPRRSDILHPDTLLLATWHVDPNLELSLLPALLKSKPIAPGATTFQMLDRIDDDPENIYFNVHTRRSSLKSLLTRLAEHSGLGLKVSKSAMEALASRKQAIHVEDTSMSLLLDGLCVPFGLSWHVSEGTVMITTADGRSPEENAQFLMERVVRLLDSARIEAADSPQSGHTRIAYGCILYEHGKTADAAHLFNGQLQTGSSRLIDIEAAFNLGKCYQTMGQLEEAEQAWYRCVDGAGKDRLARIAGYLCLSRLQLEDARFQRAASSLVQAVHHSIGSPLEQHAAAMLGSAYLLAGNAPAANDVMFEHNDSMDDKKILEAVAFASALARFRAAGLEQRREIEARDVVATLSHFNPSEAFGAHWHVLAAQACDEIGLAEPAIRHYRNAVQQLDTGRLRQIAMIQLAERYRSDDQLTEAGSILQAVATQDSDPLSHEIGLQKADIALRENQLDTAIELCHQIAVDSEDENVRRRALRMMGRAFEKQHDHESAVYCFAGMLPQKLTSQAVRPAGHEGLQ